MGAIGSTITQHTVQGSRRVHFGTLTMSSSYAASGDTYTDLSDFGMDVVENLTLQPIGTVHGFEGYWNSGATRIKVVTARPASSYVPGATALVLYNTDAGNVISIQAVGGTAFMSTGTGAAPVFSFIRGALLTLHASNSAANDLTNALATGSFGSVATYTIFNRAATSAPGLPLYAHSANTFLHTTASTQFGLPSDGAGFLLLSDGGLVRIGGDTSAYYRLSSGTGATGLRVRTTAAFNISYPVSGAMSLAQAAEPPTGADLSTGGANVRFRFTAVGY